MIHYDMPTPCDHGQASRSLPNGVLTFICTCAHLEGLKVRLPKPDIQRLLWILSLPYSLKVSVLVFKFRLSTSAFLGIKKLKQHNDYFLEAETGMRGQILEVRLLSFNLSTSILFEIFGICKCQFCFTVFLRYPRKERSPNFQPVMVSSLDCLCLS